MRHTKQESKTLSDIVENYKKMMLFSIRPHKVEDTIIANLKTDIAELNGSPNSYWRDHTIAKVIAYLEFGFPYEKYESLFESVLELCDMDYSTLWQWVNSKAQYVKTNMEELRKIIIWRSSDRRQYINKGAVLTEIINIAKSKKFGTYLFATEQSAYELEVTSEQVILRNVSKGVQYYLI